LVGGELYGLGVGCFVGGWWFGFLVDDVDIVVVVGEYCVDVFVYYCVVDWCFDGYFDC